MHGSERVCLVCRKIVSSTNILRVLLDRKGFQKLLYDAPNVFNGQFNIGDANLAFVQACEDGNDALDLEGLFEALMFIAWKKYPQEGLHHASCESFTNCR